MSKPEKDFFISYTSADREFAEWIAWCLEQAGYRVIIQAWDFPAGSNFVYEMDKALKEALRVIAVLSPAYLASQYAFSEWAVAFQHDPQGKERLLLPVRVQPCEVKGLLGPIVYCDLVGCDEKMARERLVAAARGKQDHPSSVVFPGAPSHSADASPRFPGSLPPIWNIPYPRNPFFTGRDDLLTRLATELKAGQATALSQAQAISGLGGIGKTQIAVEYAYQHRDEYQAVLWTLSDTRESLVSGYIAIAKLLNLPQKDEQDQAVIIGAVKSWLQTHGSWLLILDNADELSLVREFIPPTFGGHLLLTTRAQSMGRLASRIEVDTMDKDMGALFLLRRVGLVGENASLDAASSEDAPIARSICEELDGLPLALDQAGAFIEETQSSLTEYLHLYRTRRAELLKERGGLVDDHREPVATTWSISFANVEEKSPAAADLLRMSAFLAPDAIPEEIITEGAEHLGPHLQKLGTDPLLLKKAIAALGAYSLVRRHPSDQTLSIHRLVQVVLRDTMNDEMRKQWAERAVRSVNAVFPEVKFEKVTFETWPQSERYLSHALSCAEQVEQEQVESLEAAHLIYKAGCYLIERTRVSEAYPLLQQVLVIREQQLGPEHIDTAGVIDRLARCFELQGQYKDAEPLYQRALAIKEQHLGPEHPDTASSLNNLAVLYGVQSKYEMAEPLFQRVLFICNQKLGPMHPDTAASLNNLASLYEHQGKYEMAESLYQRALSIYEQQLGLMHPDTASSLSNLALFYGVQGKYKDAEPLLQRALAIHEQQLGGNHPDTALGLGNLAYIFIQQGKYAEAEPLLQRALPIFEQQLGTQHPHTAACLSNLATLYLEMKDYERAEPLYQRALSINERAYGPEHPEVARDLNNLAEIYRAQGKYEEALPFYQRALSIREQQLGPMHPDTANSLNNLALFYDVQGKYEQAEPLYQRALSICEQQLGTDHPYMAQCLHNLATLYYDQGKYQTAEPLFKRALLICEQTLGEVHPNTQRTRQRYISLLRKMGRDDEATTLETTGQLPSE